MLYHICIKKLLLEKINIKKRPLSKQGFYCFHKPSLNKYKLSRQILVSKQGLEVDNLKNIKKLPKKDYANIT